MYDKFKVLLSQEQYFKEWAPENVLSISEEKKLDIYRSYVTKAIVLQRDNFKCINADCDSPESKLTIHHIKFRKNKGKDTPKNCVTLCRSCHSGFHKGKEPLKFWGHTWRIHKDEKLSPKQLKFIGARIRKENKHLIRSYKVSWEMLAMIMKYLFEDMKDFTSVPSIADDVYETEENENDDVE